MAKATLEDLKALEGMTLRVANPMPSHPFRIISIAGPDGSYRTLRFRDDGRLWDSDDQEILDDLVDPEKHAARLNPPPAPEPGPPIPPLEVRLADALDKLPENASAKDLMRALKDATK